MAQSPVILPLAFSPSSEVPQPASQAGAEVPHPLWLALVFPKLALEVHVEQRRNVPAVAIKEYKGRCVVHSASRLAEIQGISADMPLNAAYALCPGLKVYPFNERAQLDRLRQLAVWAGQFTSKVNVQKPRALLLEVRGSVKLFGGLSTIHDLIRQQLAEQWQHSFHSAVTPTPEASLLLAHNGQGDVVKNKQHLRSVLGRLPVNTLPVGLKEKQALRNTGIQCLRDIWRLPRDGLARRFGPELINYLDRALGLAPDPLDFFASPDEFEAFYEFPMEVQTIDLLFNVAEQLLQQLTIVLRQRDACINQCQFHLYHDMKAATNIVVGVRKPTRDHQHLATLLEEHLNHLTLQAPVKTIKLIATEFMPFSPVNISLFFDPELDHLLTHKDSDIETLVEQLQARMGRDAINTFCSVADHRPEYAYRVNESAAEKREPVKQHRPFWLLPEPRLLPHKKHQLWLQGPVIVVKGPERIQAGWWSGDDVSRDYYIAVDNKGRHLWIYQELKQQRRWYLHGLFA